MTHKVKWSCSLSNGETIYEGKGEYEETKDKLSPYQRLLRYLQDKDVSITSLSLYLDDGSRWNLPSAGKNPKFKAFDDAEKPLSYKFFRRVGADVIGGGEMQNSELYAVIEAQYENKTLQTWVQDKEPHASWSLII